MLPTSMGFEDCMSILVFLEMIHWLYQDIIDPLGRPTITAGSDNYFPTCCPSVHASVRPGTTYQNLAKQNKF